MPVIHCTRRFWRDRFQRFGATVLVPPFWRDRFWRRAIRHSAVRAQDALARRNGLAEVGRKKLSWNRPRCRSDENNGKLRMLKLKYDLCQEFLPNIWSIDESNSIQLPFRKNSSQLSWLNVLYRGSGSISAQRLASATKNEAGKIIVGLSIWNSEIGQPLQKWNL